MIIKWPGMSKDRLIGALHTVNDAAEQNSCVCNRTGDEPAKHQGGCWVKIRQADHRIVRTLIEKLKGEEWLNFPLVPKKRR